MSETSPDPIKRRVSRLARAQKRYPAGKAATGRGRGRCKRGHMLALTGAGEYMCPACRREIIEKRRARLLELDPDLPESALPQIPPGDAAGQ